MVKFLVLIDKRKTVNEDFTFLRKLTYRIVNENIIYNRNKFNNIFIGLKEAKNENEYVLESSFHKEKFNLYFRFSSNKNIMYVKKIEVKKI